jgi:murein endopeptidase
MLGSMSRQRGGPLGGHKSHQTGRDLDVGLPRKPGVSPWKTLTRHRIDWQAAWALVRALADADVAVIYLDYGRQRWLRDAAREAGATDEEIRRVLQYPRGSAARRGIVRHADGHTGHLHVRFRCGPCETECVDRSDEGREGPEPDPP